VGAVGGVMGILLILPPVVCVFTKGVRKIEKSTFVILNAVKNLEMTGRRYTYTAFILHIQDSSLSLRMTEK
jgi:hypothetical protein